MTKEAELELRHKLTEEQSLLQQAGVPAISVTVDEREIALQRRIIRLIMTTDAMAMQQIQPQQQMQPQQQQQQQQMLANLANMLQEKQQQRRF